MNTSADNAVIEINDDFGEIEDDYYYIKNDSNFENHKSEDVSSNISNLYKLNNYFSDSNIDINNDTDVDPNFADKRLKKEEEKRRQREVEEFEKRIQPQNNIIDFDEINKKEDDSIEVNEGEEDILIDNSNYLYEPKKNSLKDKNEDIQKKNKNKINNIIYENKSEDCESKTTQRKNNDIHSYEKYEKDDINSNNMRYKIKGENIKFINSNHSIKNDIIDNNYSNYINAKRKDNNCNNNNDIDITQSIDYNMNFYDTSRLVTKETNKNTNSNYFEVLLPNKSFKKFLKNKIRYYMNEKDIPKDFINNLKLDENGNNITQDINQNKINKNKNNLTPYSSSNNIIIDYSNYYSEKILENLQKKNTLEKQNNKSTHNFYRNKTNNIEHNNLYFYSDNNIGSIDNLDNYERLSNYDKVFIENKINKEKIENLKKELNNQKNEMFEKVNKINILENMNDNLKHEMNKLQQTFEFERINNKETKKNYDIIKNNYTDMKNQYDLLNIKYQTLSDENFNYRRDKDLYEKQIKSKNEMIENLLENNSSYKKQNINNKLNKINSTTKSSNEIISTFSKNDNINNNSNNHNNINDKENKNIINKNDNIGDNGNINNNDNDNDNEKNKKIVDYNKYDKLTYPELQCKRDELSRERKDTYNIYCKIPMKSTSKEQIIKREELEKKIEEINCDLMVVKLRLKNFKNHK